MAFYSSRVRHECNSHSFESQKCAEYAFCVSGLVLISRQYLLCIAFLYLSNILNEKMQQRRILWVQLDRLTKTLKCNNDSYIILTASRAVLTSHPDAHLNSNKLFLFILN